MKPNLLRNLSANALQLMLNQLFGLVIFYILSTGLNKNDFGQINLALAVLLAAFNILSMGIDQLIVKKVASGEHAPSAFSLYMFHVIITGTIFYGVLLLINSLLPHSNTIYNLVLLLGIGKLMIFFSTPFKQVASGQERFKLVAYMSVISNLVRSICLLVFALLHIVNVHLIVIIFIAGDVAELIICGLIFKFAMQIPLALKWDKAKYKSILREAIPQSGVVVITSALARFDWIFIGLILSAVKLAEYSFAYKIFEIATLPLLTIAPLLIPRFTKMFQQGAVNIEKLKFLVRVECVIAFFVALILNICWAPVIDYITAGKYGAVNSTTILILSLCMPLIYLNNFFWTMYFAQGLLKMILTSFIITLLVNVIGDIVLIPIYKNEGAAFAFLLSCFAQTAFYLYKNKIPELNATWQPLIITLICASISGLIFKTMVPNMWIALPASAIFYGSLIVITRQIKLSDKRLFVQIFSNAN